MDRIANVFQPEEEKEEEGLQIAANWRFVYFTCLDKDKAPFG